MHLGFHGGLCCGIKVVHGFYVYPESELSALKEIQINNADAFGNNVKSSDRFFHEAAPRESALSRLERYISYMEVHRPQNILEAVLTTDQLTTYKWAPELERLGFKEVNRHTNSNSMNTIVVFHLNINKPQNIVTDEDEDDDYDDPFYYDDEE